MVEKKGGVESIDEQMGLAEAGLQNRALETGLDVFVFDTHGLWLGHWHLAIRRGND